jgi:hypothetical protein
MMLLLLADCSGPAEAGMKWLRRAGFGTAPSYSTNPPHADAIAEDENLSLHPLQRLKIQYDPRLWYSTFHYTITPALAERLSIPGGYHHRRAIYNFLPDARVELRSLYMMRNEGDTRTGLFCVFLRIYLGLTTCGWMCSPGLQWSPGRHGASGELG